MRQRSVQMGLIVHDVKPDSKLWAQYLRHNYPYMLENWPSKVINISEDVFCQTLDQKLKERYTSGRRGYFIYTNEDNEFVGFSNVYIRDHNVLDISEFYVAPKCRRHGYGAHIVRHVLDWGNEHGAEGISFEVDKDIPTANAFWETFGFTLDDSGTRNLYSCDMGNIATLRLRG